MKKRLLSMALAAVFCVGTYAYEVGDYMFTKDARLKVAGANIASNDYNQTDNWSNENGGPLAANWKVVAIAGPDGSNVTALQSQGASAEEGTALTSAWQLQNGIYAISFYVYSPAAASISISAGGNNFMSLTSGDPSRQINAVATLAEAAWTQVSDTVVVSGEQEILHFKATGVAEGVCLTDFQIVPVEAVYDIRIAQKEMAYAQKLLDDPNFNTEVAAGARNNVLRVINSLNQKIEAGELDDENDAESLLTRMNTALVTYMNATSEDLALNSNFQYIEDLEDMPQYNRGKIANGQQIGGFKFYGDHWQHGVYRGEGNAIIEGPNGKKGLPYIQKAIQAGQNGPGPGSVVLANASMPAGKYYVAAKMYNAYQDSKYNPSYTLEAAVKGFVGTDTVELGTIVGENYEKLYFVAELKDGESLEAGFWWEGTTQGGLWTLRDFEIRRFGAGAADAIAHTEAWKAFKAQYDAMVSSRKDVEAMVGNKDYPWSQQVLVDSLNKWNPKYEAEVAKGWVAEDGTDAGVASTDELNDWVKQQGQDPTAEDYQPYPIVRGYQGAKNQVVADNKVFPDLAADIEAAKGVLADPMNVNGDKKTFQAAIDAAQTTYNDIFANTTAASMEADSLTMSQARVDLAAAVEAFKASAVLTPIIDIDFSNTFEAVEEEGETVAYVIKGAAGEMTFPVDVVETDNTQDVTKFQLGWGEVESVKEVLRVGKGAGTVELSEVPSDNDIIRASFDVWFGKFVTYGYLSFDLQNAAGERIAGFSYCRYDNATKYNDFPGLDFGKSNNISNVNNESIYTDANKTTMDIIVDHKAQSIQAVMTTSSAVYTSELAPMPALEDTKVAKVVLASEYSNAGRRSWFDNLKVYQYASQAEGPIFDAIKSINVKSADNAVYTLSGLRVKGAVKPGLYIVNGKKVVIK